MKRFIAVKKDWYLASHVNPKHPSGGLFSFEVEAVDEESAAEIAWEKILKEDNEDLTLHELKEKDIKN